MILSTFRKFWVEKPITFPKFSGTRIMMMPVKLGSLTGVPKHYWAVVSSLYSMMELRHNGEIGYLTIDERYLEVGESLRRPGKHVDGYYHGRCGAWGGGGSWGSVGNGMIVMSNTEHCVAYPGVFIGDPGPEGECEHISTDVGVTFSSNEPYWVDGACIHESMPVTEPTARQFIRLSLPSNGPWFKGYTENPEGIKPSNETLEERKFMN